MTLVYALKHTTHCWIVVILLASFCLSLLATRSRKVSSGAPNRLGNNSLSSRNSPLQILSASFLGTGGEWVPTATASLEGDGTAEGNRLGRGVDGERPATTPELPR